MPTYQYACTTCGEQLEVVQSFSSDPLTECPACQGRLRKVFHPVGVVFKGSGFYRTDSRSSGSSSRGTTTGGSAAATSSSGSSGSSGSAASSGSAGSSGSTGSSGSGATSGSASS